MKKKHIYRILFFCPLLLGVIGFVGVEHINFLDGVFNSVLMYLFNYGDTPPNVWVELARWTAPIATASSILLLISTAKQYTVARIKMLFTNSVAVYGPEKDAEQILSQLGFRGIRGVEVFLPAQNYILLFEREKNITFYEENRKSLRNAQVYMRCDTLPAQSLSSSNVHLFKPMEIIARLFWKTGELLPAAEKKNAQLSIVCIGFGQLGKELLYWGLQNNIFSPHQKIVYHIFGDANEFLSAHPMLAQIEDPVLIYHDSWLEHLSVLSEADLILFSSQDGESAPETTVYQLLSLVPEKRITVFTDSPVLLSMLDEQQRLRIIDVGSQSLQVSHIMESDLLKNAMKVNLRYANLYNNVEETEANALSEWNKLSAFLRYSNISTADYHEIRCLMIRRMGSKSDGSGLTAEQKELLAELEHMRWCRYHWLNNWRYGKPEDGKAKDTSRRIHTDLIPYSELSEPEKKKDRDTIEVLLGL